MKEKAFLEMCARLARDTDTITLDSSACTPGPYQELERSKIMFVHGALGLASELGEYQDAKNNWLATDLTTPRVSVGLQIQLKDALIEEAGDVLHYVAYCQLAQNISDSGSNSEVVSLERPIQIEGVDCSRGLIGPVTVLADLAKKWLIYEKPPRRESVAAAVGLILSELRCLGVEPRSHRESPLDFFRQANADKLAKRYPQGFFTSEDAVKRADKS